MIMSYPSSRFSAGSQPMRSGNLAQLTAPSLNSYTSYYIDSAVDSVCRGWHGAVESLGDAVRREGGRRERKCEGGKEGRKV